MKFRVNIDTKAAKENPLKNNKNLSEKLLTILSETPFPDQHNKIKRLKHWKGMYSLRIGVYRVIFRIKGNDVNITEIGLRRDIY